MFSLGFVAFLAGRAKLVPGCGPTGLQSSFPFFYLKRTMAAVAVSQWADSLVFSLVTSPYHAGPKRLDSSQAFQHMGGVSTRGFQAGDLPLSEAAGPTGK